MIFFSHNNNFEHPHLCSSNINISFISFDSYAVLLCAVEKRFINFKTRFIDKNETRYREERASEREGKSRKININIYKVSPHILTLAVAVVAGLPCYY